MWTCGLPPCATVGYGHSFLVLFFFFWFNMAVSWVNGNVQSDTRMQWFDDAGRAESLFSYIQSFSMPERLLR